MPEERAPSRSATQQDRPSDEKKTYSNATWPRGIYLASHACSRARRAFMSRAAHTHDRSGGRAAPYRAGSSSTPRGRSERSFPSKHLHEGRGVFVDGATTAERAIRGGYHWGVPGSKHTLCPRRLVSGKGQSPRCILPRAHTEELGRPPRDFYISPVFSAEEKKKGEEKRKRLAPIALC